MLPTCMAVRTLSKLLGLLLLYIIQPKCASKRSKIGIIVHPVYVVDIPGLI